MPAHLRWWCACASLLLANGLFSTPAAAIETNEPVADSQPEPSVDETDSAEEVVVFGDLEVARRRKAIDTQLRHMGYSRSEKKNGRTRYIPDIPWKATVIVDDDGFIALKRSPIRYEPIIKGDSKLRHLSCIPPFILMCIRIGGKTISARKLNHAKAEVAYRLEPDVRSWRRAIIDRAMQQRVDIEVPDMLDAIWVDGVAPHPNIPPVDTPQAKKAAILQFWGSRSCTPEGDQVAEVVAMYMAFEVQSSSTPLTTTEIAQAEQAANCGRRLDLNQFNFSW